MAHAEEDLWIGRCEEEVNKPLLWALAFSLQPTLGLVASSINGLVLGRHVLKELGRNVGRSLA